MTKPILITGGAGFIGSALVRHLAGRGDQIVTVDALTYAGSLDSIASAMAAPNTVFEHVDITDAGALARVSRKRSSAGLRATRSSRVCAKRSRGTRQH